MKRKSIKNIIFSLFLVIFFICLLSVAIVCFDRIRTPPKVDVEKIIIDEENLIF